MPTARRPWITPIAVVACATSLAACSGGSSARTPPSGGEQEQKGSRDIPGVSATDRLAYYQLATTTGALRLVLSGAAVGRPQPLRRHDAAALRLARRRLRGLAPRDPLLRRALVMLRPSVALVAGARAGKALPAAAAQTALARTGRAVRLLHRFAQHHPALSALLPD